MRRVLVTGVTGFAGSHLVDYMLTRNDCEIFGIQRWRSPLENIEHVKDKITLVECDLRDASSTRDTLERIRPDWIFHLAAQSFVPTSWSAPTESLTTNVLGELNIFEAVRRIGLACRIQLACSSEEYGMVFPDELPIKETNPLRPLSPYAVSKVAQDMLGYQYFASHNLPVVRVRPFNHIGPGQAPSFVTADFARQIAEAEAGLRPPILSVGNLDARRDFSDVRDIVRGYYMAITQGKPGEVYNLGSERSHSIREVLDILLSVSTTHVSVQQDKSRLRPSDVPEVVSDCSKFRELTGWTVQIPFERTLSDILDYWRAQVRH